LEALTKHKTRELVINKDLLINTHRIVKKTIIDIEICDGRRFMLGAVHGFLKGYRKKSYTASLFQNEVIDDIYKQARLMRSVSINLEQMESVVLAIDFCARCLIHEERFQAFTNDENRFFREAQRFVDGYKVATGE